jgi:hypothetical protein
MSPVSTTRYVVTALDYDLWQIVVEAFSERDAINKAHAIYSFNRFEESCLVDSNVSWSATPLVREVRS